MNIHEYQAKGLLAKYGVAVPRGGVAFSADEAVTVAKQLGGRFEPVGKDFEGSTITVPTGAEHVPGLAEPLQATEIPKVTDGERQPGA